MTTAAERRIEHGAVRYVLKQLEYLIEHRWRVSEPLSDRGIEGYLFSRVLAHATTVRGSSDRTRVTTGLLEETLHRSWREAETDRAKCVLSKGQLRRPRWREVEETGT